MSIFNENTLQLLRELVQRETKFQDNSEELDYVYEFALNKLQMADSMFFVTQKDIDLKMDGFVDKFLLNGCIKQAEDLKQLYNKLFSKNPSKDELQNRLNVMMMLFSLSEKPGSYLPSMDNNLHLHVPQEQAIDWGTYLMEGIERWSPPLDSDSDLSDGDSMLSNSPEDSATEMGNSKSDDLLSNKKAINDIKSTVFNRRYCQGKILMSVQNNWFNADFVRMLPASSHSYANAALEWEEFINNITMGLVDVRTSIISEYKITREIIWQFWRRSNGVAYKFSNDSFTPNPAITIASCRPEALQHFLTVFLPYINVLNEFRELECDVITVETNQFPDTYKNYCSSVKNILTPTMKMIVELEEDIVKQEETMTLIKLEHISKTLFKPLLMLKTVHERMKTNRTEHTSLHHATNLLAKLSEGLENPSSKAEQDMYLCLYLESLYKYLTIIHNWLNKGEFLDVCKEFPIIQLGLDREDCQSEFIQRPLEDVAANDDFLVIICTRVLQIGRNIHLLHLLEKFHLVTFRTETLYEEYVTNVLSAISTYFNKEFTEIKEHDDNEELYVPPAYRFPAICTDFCKIPTEMDRLDNLVDTSNIFLMKAFESFFEDQNDKKDTYSEELLYSRITRITEGFFPAKALMRDVFPRILEDRYSECGIILKQVIKNDYKFEDHLNLLCHIFLFKDDVIFPFYKRLFEKVVTGQYCGNDVRLTSHLQDILMDVHPQYYGEVIVTVGHLWEDFLGNNCKNSSLFRIKYNIKWPISIVVRVSQVKMYEEMFYFIFQIKWALYILNHLNFKDIEPRKGETKKHNNTLRLLQMRLKVLRFGLINIFSLIQHYVLGYVLPKCYMEYDAQYAKSYDLDSLIESHDNFITKLYKHSTYLRDYNEDSYGFFMLLHLVRNLSAMWKNPGEVDSSKLETFQTGYMEVHKRLQNIVMPINDVFNDSF